MGTWEQPINGASPWAAIDRCLALVRTHQHGTAESDTEARSESGF